MIQVVSKGMELLNSVLPPDAFYDQGWPNIIMTDKCAELRRDVLAINWPNAR